MTARDFAKSLGGAFVRRVGRAAGRFQEEAPLAVDVLESDDEYLVVFDAPGATASDVQVNYQGDTVRVRIDRFREYREGFEMRFPGRGLSMDGEATLPPDAAVNADDARAHLRDDGTLYVFLPKDERAETTSVSVTTEGEDSGAYEGGEAYKDDGAHEDGGA